MPLAAAARHRDAVCAAAAASAWPPGSPSERSGLCLRLCALGRLLPLCEAPGLCSGVDSMRSGSRAQRPKHPPQALLLPEVPASSLHPLKQRNHRHGRPARAAARPSREHASQWHRHGRAVSGTTEHSLGTCRAPLSSGTTRTGNGARGRLADQAPPASVDPSAARLESRGYSCGGEFRARHSERASSAPAFVKKTPSARPQPAHLAFVVRAEVRIFSGLVDEPVPDIDVD